MTGSSISRYSICNFAKFGCFLKLSYSSKKPFSKKNGVNDLF